MFCVNCGKELPDDSKFCSGCGKALRGSVSDINSKMNTGSQVKLVPAKCTGCGATLEVDARENAAICPYCKNAYIVEQAINNYNIKMSGNLSVGSATINVSGVNVDNLLVRAKNFASQGDFENALDYYNRVLDIDFSKQEAHDGIERINDHLYMIDNYVYFWSNAGRVSSSGVLQLKKKRLVFLSSGGKETLYYLYQINKLTRSLSSIQFEYNEKSSPVIINFTFGLSKKWFSIINSAINGSYPKEYYR